MNRKSGHGRAGLHRRVGADDARRSTRRKLTIAAAAWSVLACLDIAQAQPVAHSGKAVRVALLRTPAAKQSASDRIFEDATRELGWVEGRDIIYDRAYADGDDKRLPALAAALAARKPDLIHLRNNPELRAALAATRETRIPIVFAAVADPVESGFIKSLRRPEGNVTGVTSIGWQLSGKRMELLKEALPHLSRIGVLFSPGHLSAQSEIELIKRAAGPRVQATTLTVNSPKDIDAAFAAAVASRVEAVFATNRPVFGLARMRIMELASTHRVPVVGPGPAFAQSGALISYSSIFAEHLRRSAHMVDKILRGTKPADIPVEQPTKFALIVNLKTAKALGITIPQSVLLQASQVIE